MTGVVTDQQHALRIAVDGASGAGKTTTARALGERLGQQVITEGEGADGRTELFDWMDYAGGRHRGRPIQTQVIAVPGHLDDRRRAILELADVVLFVADSTPAGIDETARSFGQLQAICAALDPPPGIVVQANKRDAADAFGVEEIRVLLELPDDMPVVETVATAGDGVRQAFVFAVRHGLARLDAIDGTDRVTLTPDGLADHLRAVGPDTPSPGLDPEHPEPDATPTPGHLETVARAVAVDLDQTDEERDEPYDRSGDGRATGASVAGELVLDPDLEMDPDLELWKLDGVAVPATADAPAAADTARSTITDDSPAAATATAVPPTPAADAAPEPPVAGQPDGFAHLPPPPAAPAPASGRSSWWRRARSAPEGAGER